MGGAVDRHHLEQHRRESADDRELLGRIGADYDTLEHAEVQQDDGVGEDSIAHLGQRELMVEAQDDDAEPHRGAEEAQEHDHDDHAEHDAPARGAGGSDDPALAACDEFIAGLETPGI